jgi:hypothetical protein
VFFPQMADVAGKGVELLPDGETLDLCSSQTDVLTAASKDSKSYRRRKGPREAGLSSGRERDA